MPRFKYRFVPLILAVFPSYITFMAGPSAASAGTALNFTAVTGGYEDGDPRVIGWEFTTGSQPISVNQLGVFDFNGESLLTAHGVAIYDNQTQAEIVTATVPSGTSAALSGLFRYVSVAPRSFSRTTAM